MGDVELRAAARKTANISVLYRAGLHRGAARLVNISHTGALLEPSVTIPPVRASATIKFKPPGQDEPISIDGRVVRYTASGFAVEFLSLNRKTHQMIAGLE